VASGKRAKNEKRVAAARAEPAKVGRPTLFSQETATKILHVLAGGGLIDDITASEDFPSKTTVFEWRRNHPDFAAAYALAVQQRGERYGDQIAEVVAELRAGTIDPQSAAGAINGLRFLASRQAPKLYGDNAKVELTGAEGTPLIPAENRDPLDLARWVALVLDRGAEEADRLASETETAAIAPPSVNGLIEKFKP
jgi:hypothetical protein